MIKKKSILIMILLIFFSSYITGFGEPEQTQDWKEFFQKARNTEISLEEKTIYFPAISEEDIEYVGIVANFGAYTPIFTNAVGCVPPSSGGDIDCIPVTFPNYANILMKGVNVFINSTASDNIFDGPEPLRLFVCDNSGSTSSGCANTTYCSTIQSTYSANPFCTISTSTFNEGAYEWNAFIYDSGASNNVAAANPRSGNFVIDDTAPTISITSLEGDTTDPYTDPTLNDPGTSCDTTLVINPGDAKSCRWSKNVGDSFPDMPNNCSLTAIDPLLVVAWGFDDDTSAGIGTSFPSLNTGGVEYGVGGGFVPNRQVNILNKMVGAGSYVFLALFNGYVQQKTGTINMNTIAADGSYTIMAWVKPVGVPNSGLDCGNNASKCHYKIAGKEINAIGLKYTYQQFFDARICNGNSTCISLVSSAYPPNVWHHVAMIVNTSTKELKLCIDGANVTPCFTTPIPGGWTELYNNAGDQFRVGQNEQNNNTADALPFNGWIDEVKFYQRALSEAEVLGIWSNETSGVRLQYNSSVCELDSINGSVCDSGWTNNSTNTAYFACADGVQDGTGDGIIVPTTGNFSGNEPIDFCIGICDSTPQAPVINNLYAIGSGTPCNATAFNTTNTTQFSFTPGVDYLCVVIDLTDPNGNDDIVLANSSILAWSAPGTEADALAGDGWNHHKNFSFVECDGTGTPKVSLGSSETKLCAQLDPSTDNTSSTGIGVKDVSGIGWEIKTIIEDAGGLSDNKSLSSIMNLSTTVGISNNNSGGCSFSGSPGTNLALTCGGTPTENVGIIHEGNIDLDASIEMTSDLVFGPDSIDGTSLFWNATQIADPNTLPGAFENLFTPKTIVSLWNSGNTDPDTPSTEDTYLYISLPTDLMSGTYSGGIIKYIVTVS